MYLHDDEYILILFSEQIHQERTLVHMIATLITITTTTNNKLGQLLSGGPNLATLAAQLDVDHHVGTYACINQSI